MRFLTVFLCALLFNQSLMASYSANEVKALRLAGSIKNKKQEIAITCAYEDFNNCDRFQFSLITKINHNEYEIDNINESLNFTKDEVKEAEQRLKEILKTPMRYLEGDRPDYLTFTGIDNMTLAIMLVLFPVLITYVVVESVTLPVRAPFVFIKRKLNKKRLRKLGNTVDYLFAFENKRVLFAKKPFSYLKYAIKKF